MLLRRGLRHAIRRPAAPRVQRSASSQRNATTTALPAALGLLGLGGASAWCLSIEDWSKRVDDPALEATFEGWTRADAAIVKDGLAANSAIYDALGARTEGLRQYKIFAKKDGSAVSAIATFGDCCVGHPGVVHGGVTSLLFDNTLGWANAYSVLGERGALDADPVEAAALRKSSTKLFGNTSDPNMKQRPTQRALAVRAVCAFVSVLTRLSVLASPLAHSRRHLSCTRSLHTSLSEDHRVEHRPEALHNVGGHESQHLSLIHI